MTALRALRKVLEQEGVFCALYSDRPSHFIWTRKVDRGLTQVGRAFAGPGTRMIPAYSPQARGVGAGLSKLAGMLASGIAFAQDCTLEQANDFLQQEYLAEFDQRFPMSASQAGNAFSRCQGKDLDVLFWGLTGCSVTICEHLDQSWSMVLTLWVTATPRDGPCLSEAKQDGPGKTLPGKVLTSL